MKAKVFGMLAFVMFALAGTGIAYGHWQDPVYVNTQITTGTLCITLSDEGISSNQCTFTGDKPVATYWDYLTPNQNCLDIYMCNVYPCLVVNGTFNIYNNGTIPAALNGINWCITDQADPYLTIVPCAENSNIYVVTDNYTWCPQAFIYVNSTSGPAAGQDNPNNTPATLSQIDPGQTLYVTWYVCFTENLCQNQTWCIGSTWCFVNWNELGSIS
jgi:hypothetical protein